MRWQRRWGAGVVLHQTQRNKNDEQTGVEALLPPLYRQGPKTPPTDADFDALSFVTKFVKELTEYLESATKDLVMEDWQAEWNLAKVLALGRRSTGRPTADAKLPRYLKNAKRIPYEQALRLLWTRLRASSWAWHPSASIRVMRRGMRMVRTRCERPA
jgi:hypothetical protein